MPKKICVTGAAGKAGRVAVAELLDQGYQVLATDIVPHPPTLPGPNSRPDFGYTRADLTDYGDTVELLSGVDAVVHLANIPAPRLFTPARTFNVNTAMNSNVFLAAIQNKLEKVVWAATEATHLAEWSGIPFIALRLSNVLYPEDYQQLFPPAWADPHLRKWNLWSYIDARDAAQGMWRALEADVTGARSYIIANADTVMTTPSADLMAQVWPGVKLTREIGEFETLMTIDKARRELGYEPTHTWRDHIQPPA